MELPMMTLLTDPNAWAALLALTALEIVLGIDNVIFISVLAARLDPASSRRARQAGLLLAFILRIALLFGLTALARLRYPVVTTLIPGCKNPDQVKANAAAADLVLS